MSAIHRDNGASIRLTEQTFDEAVAANTKLLLVDFWAEWCGPCRAIAPVLEEVGRVEAQRVTVAKVNVDENPTLAARFGVRSIPTILFFKGDALVDQVVGALPRARLQARIDALV
jgi:thioredoxin 1